MVMFDVVKPITILESVVDAMRYTGNISARSANGVNWDVTIEDTSLLKQYEYFTNNNVRYRIESITNSTVMVVSGASIPTVGAYKCEAPYFYHGTPIKVQGERDADMVGNEMKYPFICLFEPLRSRLDATRDNTIAEAFNLWLVFMTANNLNWSTSEHHNNAINDMYILFQRFLAQTEQTPSSIALLEDNEKQTPDITRHAEFGLIAKTKGHADYLLMDNLSGIEVENFKLNILKTYNDITC